MEIPSVFGLKDDIARLRADGYSVAIDNAPALENILEPVTASKYSKIKATY